MASNSKGQTKQKSITKNINTDILSRIPDVILLEIFTYLPVKERCIVARVCRHWRRVASDFKLWRHIDVQSYRISLSDMWKFVRRKLSPELRSLRLNGFLHKGSTTTKWKSDSLSDAMLTYLEKNCPNIRVMDVTRTNLSNVNIASFPSTLTSLTISYSHIPVGWFDPLAAMARNIPDEPGSATEKSESTANAKRLCIKILPNLKNLNLNESTKTSDADVQLISKAFPDLLSLRLSGCYRITSNGFIGISECLIGLLELDVSTATLDHHALHCLCKKLSKLKYLNISNCSALKPGAVDCVRCLKDLEELYMTGCKLGESVSVDSFKELKKLKLLDIRQTGIVVADHENLHEMYRFKIISE